MYNTNALMQKEEMADVFLRLMQPSRVSVPFTARR
jgi:hypothetical protein